MSSLSSPVKEVSRLTFYPIPNGKPLSVTKCISVDGVLVFMDDKGKLYCNKIADKCYYSFGVYPWTKGMMKGLWKMGSISKASYEDHMRLATEQQRVSERRYRAERVEGIMAELGMVPTKGQAEKIEAALKGVA